MKRKMMVLLLVIFLITSCIYFVKLKEKPTTPGDYEDDLILNGGGIT